MKTFDIVQELKYKIKNPISYPTYQFNKIYPDTKGEILITLSNNIEIIFKLSLDVFNLWISKIRFILNPLLVANHNWVLRDTVIPIKQIDLYSDKVSFTYSLKEVQKYLKVVLPVQTNYVEYLYRPININNEEYGKILRRTNDSNTFITR